jgi:putative oxidoreductase
MLERLLNTPEDPVLTIVRVVLGVVMFAHGAQKTLGWFGGYGFHGTMGVFHEQLRIPSALAFLAIMAEFFGSSGLILGLFTRVAALGIAIVMLAAIFMVHLRVGFFSNWFGNQKGEGFEYHLLAIALGVVLFARGGGAFSLDHILYQRVSSPEARQSIGVQSPVASRGANRLAGQRR